MADIKMINNYNIKDETARNEIEEIKAQIPNKADAVHTHDEYLTEHQSLEGLATETYVNNAIGDINVILDSINGEEI